MAGSVRALLETVPGQLSAQSVQPAVCSPHRPPPVWSNLCSETSGRGFRRDVCGVVDTAVVLAVAPSQLACAPQAAVCESAPAAPQRTGTPRPPDRALVPPHGRVESAPLRAFLAEGR